MEKQNQFAEFAAALKKAEAAMKVASVKFQNVQESLGYSDDQLDIMVRQVEHDNVINAPIMGKFNGVNMTADDGGIHPIPQNYASKSKLVAGDRLKMVRNSDGVFHFKTTSPVERKMVIGILTLDGSQYQVATKDKAYNVLFASVTFFRAKVGDEVTIIIPEEGDSEWGAIENVIPNSND